MATASSTFAGSENPLSEGGVWVSGIGASLDVQKSAGVAIGTSAVDFGCGKYVGAAFGADQFSEVVVSAAVSVSCGPVVRIQAASAACYLMNWDGGTSVIKIFRVTDGGSLGFVQLGGNISIVAPQAGDRFRLVARGQQLEAYINGALIGARIDANLATGAPGFFVINTTQGFTDWAGGDVDDQKTGSFFRPFFRNILER